MIKILCFGDSNTWGWNPRTKERYLENERWPGVLRDLLGSDYEIIEAGLNGRTTAWDDPLEDNKNGSKQLLCLLESNKPVNIVVIMLGTNDLKNRFAVTASDIAGGIEILINIIKKSQCGCEGQSSQILLVCPPPIIEIPNIAPEFIGARQKSHELEKHYSCVAKKYECKYIDSSEYIQSSVIDGIHLDKIEHIQLGLLIKKVVVDIFK